MTDLPPSIKYHVELFDSEKNTNSFRNIGKYFAREKQWALDLGANPFLLGFKCGVVLDTTNMEYHVGTPADMLMKVLKHTRAEVEAVDPGIEAEIRRFIADTMITKEAATFLLDLLSYIVSGNRSAHSIILFHGSGSNGKTVLERLIRTMLGMYCVVAEIKLITKKGGAAEAAESKLMATRGALCALFPEPDAREKT